MLQKKNRDNKRNTMKKWFIYAIHNIFNYQGRARRAGNYCGIRIARTWSIV